MLFGPKHLRNRHARFQLSPSLCPESLHGAPVRLTCALMPTYPFHRVRPFKPFECPARTTSRQHPADTSKRTSTTAVEEGLPACRDQGAGSDRTRNRRKHAGFQSKSLMVSRVSDCITARPGGPSPNGCHIQLASCEWFGAVDCGRSAPPPHQGQEGPAGVPRGPGSLLFRIFPDVTRSLVR